MVIARLVQKGAERARQTQGQHVGRTFLRGADRSGLMNGAIADLGKNRRAYSASIGLVATVKGLEHSGRPS